VTSLPFIKQYINGKFNKAMNEFEVKMEVEFEKGRDPHKSRKLPLEGMKKENLESRILKWAKEEENHTFSGKLSGMMYSDGRDFCREVSDFAARYMYHNPLHLDAFKELSKMEAEVLAMTNNLISKERLYGMITSGGSESLIMTLHAYKNFNKKERPNV
jgi:glutamate/tyrosine decarboxylase-like PLP-dependent enzyme